MTRRAMRGRANHERWLVSYADFITLLFAFFVVLYAFAKADQKKQVAVSTAITAAFRTMALRDTSAAAQSATVEDSATDAIHGADAKLRDAVDLPLNAPLENDLAEVRQKLETGLSSQLARHLIAIQTTPDGLVISLREAGFFDSGRAIPKQGTERVVHEIASSLDTTHLTIRVEGHTDNLPIHNSTFDSNWELSSARATCIARLLVEDNGIAPDRVSAAGFAGFHPVATNATAEGRAQNRRVDLVILPHIRLRYDSQNDSPDPAWRRVTDN